MRYEDLPIKIEDKRKAMMVADIQEFAELCDLKCRKAYEIRAKWFFECLESNSIEPFLKWMTHWLTGYLMHPDLFRSGCEGFKTPKGS